MQIRIRRMLHGRLDYLLSQILAFSIILQISIVILTFIARLQILTNIATFKFFKAIIVSVWL